MPKTMSIGGATYDLFVQTYHDIVHGDSIAFPLGEKIRVKNLVETCGGGASNTSVGLARLGCDAHFAGVLGSDQWGDKLLHNLQQEGVRTDCATVVEGEISSFSIILSAGSGERVILYEPGTNAHLHDATFDREKAFAMDLIYLNHILEGSCIIQDDIIDVLVNCESTRLTWNPGGCQFDIGIEDPHNAALLSHTNLLILNKEEAMRFTRKDSPEQALQALVNAGAAIVCITDGKNGTTATDGKTACHCDIQTDINVIDTTGAGDAFGIGATWALLMGMNVEDMLRAGTLNAASVIQHIGAQKGLLTKAEMTEKMKEAGIKVDVDPTTPFGIRRAGN